MKKVLGILLVAVALLAFTGCGDLFGPIAEIDSFELSNGGTAMTPDSSGNYTIDADDSFIVYVYGNTVVDGVYSSTTDYSGTVTLTSSGTGFSAASGSLSATFDGYTGLTSYYDGASTSGYESFNPVFSTAGTYTVTITLEDSTGYDVEETFTIEVTNSSITLPTTYTDVTYGQTYAGDLTYATSVEWYRKDVGSATYYIYYWDDESNSNNSVGEVVVTAYDQDGNYLTSTYSSYHDGASSSAKIATGYGTTSSLDYVYFKVECYSSDTGEYFFQINGSTSPNTSTISSSYYTSYPTVSSGTEVDLYSFSAPGISDTVYYRDDDVDTTYTGDIKVSVWVEDEVVAFKDDETSGNYGDISYTSNVGDEIYVFVQAYSSSTYHYGTYNIHH